MLKKRIVWEDNFLKLKKRLFERMKIWIFEEKEILKGIIFEFFFFKERKILKRTLIFLKKNSPQQKKKKKKREKLLDSYFLQ